MFFFTKSESRRNALMPNDLGNRNKPRSSRFSVRATPNLRDTFAPRHRTLAFQFETISTLSRWHLVAFAHPFDYTQPIASLRLNETQPRGVQPKFVSPPAKKSCHHCEHHSGARRGRPDCPSRAFPAANFRKFVPRRLFPSGKGDDAIPVGGRAGLVGQRRFELATANGLPVVLGR